VKWYYLECNRGKHIAKWYGDAEQLRDVLRQEQALGRIGRITVVQSSDWCETWQTESGK
jgi:hypothetical protein